MHKHADAFRDFAAKIEKNDEKDFAGAFLIVPPNGDPASGIMVGEADTAMFFGLLKAKIEVVVTTIDNEAKKAQSFGRR